MDRPEFDVAVIGAGPGGYVAAIRAAQLGKRTVLIEREAVGGVCLNVGCIPSKALIHTAGLFAELQHAERFGIRLGAPATLDWPAVQAFKQSVVHKLTSGVSQLLKGNGVTLVHGTAAFSSPTQLSVRTPEGEVVIRAEAFIVATGSRPIAIPPFPIDEKRVLSSTGALALDHVPASMSVIGGGVIGLELGMAYARFGTKVSVVEMLDQLLPGVDPEVVRLVARATTKMGMVVHTSATAQRLTPTGMVAQLKDGSEVELPGEVILLSIGRRPNTEGLGLERAGVATDARGYVPVDAQCRTNVRQIFAIGDITPGPMLAHRASKQGIVAAEVIAGRPSAADFATVPGVIFTDPEVATAGLTEAAAKDAGYDVRTARFSFGANGRALGMGRSEGFVKIVADQRTDAVLGIHIVGPSASDLISEAALAIELGATVEDLAAVVHPHPTLPEVVMEAAEALHGKAIHALNRSP